MMGAQQQLGPMAMFIQALAQQAPAGFYGGQPTPTPQGTPVLGSPPWNAQNFVQGFEQNKKPNSDALYDQYLKSVQMPKAQSPHQQTTSMFSKMVGGMRNMVPFVDSQVGHQDLGGALSAYPFTPDAKKILAPATVVRDSMKPQIVEEEAETNPEKYLGIKTGRSRMDIATTTKDSPLLSVVTHEMMHSYLDKKGYPNGQAGFLADWNEAKKTTPLLSTIDQWVASSPDYSDEMNEGDIAQERFAYLAQALGGAGLQAFPQQLQRDYAPIFMPKGQ